MCAIWFISYVYIISYHMGSEMLQYDVILDRILYSVISHVSYNIQTERERDSKQFFAKLTVIFTLGEDEGHHWRCLSFLGDNQQEEIWQTVVIRRQEMVDKQSKTVAILGRLPPFLQDYLDVHSRYLQVMSGWCCCLVSQATNGYKWNKPFWRT